MTPVNANPQLAVIAEIVKILHFNLPKLKVLLKKDSFDKRNVQGLENYYTVVLI